jgi:hypothetical protein
MLLVMLVAFDGRVEWLGFAMVRYLANSSPLPGMRIPVLDALRAAYGLALLLVVVVALIRWRRSRTMLQPATAPARPVAPALSAAPEATPEAVPVSR